MVGGDAWVGGDARVVGDARVEGGVWKKSPLFVLGTRYSVFQPKPGFVQIAGQCKPLVWWSSPEAESLGNDHGFTQDECAEYRAIIGLFLAIGRKEDK